MRPEFDLTDKVAVVTGASRGIGASIAQTLAEAGARVAIVARSEGALAETATSIDPSGERVEVIAADLGREEAPAAVAERVVARFGTIDVLVNNAGVNYATPFLDTTAAEWQRTMDINLMSGVNLTREVGRVLVGQGSGSVINVTSVWANKTIPAYSAYTTSKAAFAQFTRALAREWARHNVRVNAIAPGYIATDITKDGMEDPATYEAMIRAVPQRRIGGVDEVAPLALYLAADVSSYITGSTFTIDGGMDLA